MLRDVSEEPLTSFLLTSKAVCYVITLIMIYDDDKQSLEANTYKANDYATVRKSLREKAKNALVNAFPMAWGGIRLEVKNARYDHEKDFTIKEQKDALLQDKYLTNKLKADLYLYDNKTNQLLDKVEGKTVLNVPYYTNRGTFINNGSEYTTLKQNRLRPGIYSRIKQNGELETQFNVQRGTGSGYRITLDPTTSVYRLNVGQSNVSLYSILHDLGISDEELRKTWGDQVFTENQKKYDKRALDKIHSKLVRKSDAKSNTREGKIEELRTAFERQLVDKDIKDRTLPDL